MFQMCAYGQFTSNSGFESDVLSGFNITRSGVACAIAQTYKLVPP